MFDVLGKVGAKVSPRSLWGQNISNSGILGFVFQIGLKWSKI